MTRGWRNAAVALAVGLAILLAFTVDQPIARAMAGLSPSMLRIARFVTWFGQGGVVLYPTGILTLIGLALRYARPELRGRLDPAIRAVAAIFIVVALAGLTDDGLKIIFGRARPYRWLAGDTSGFGFFRYGAKFASFPSGHTTTSFAATLAFDAVAPRWRRLFLSAALAVGISRIMLNMHYLSDVIAGAALGSLVAVKTLTRLRGLGWISSKPSWNTKMQDMASSSVEPSREKKN